MNINKPKRQKISPITTNQFNVNNINDDNIVNTVENVSVSVSVPDPDLASDFASTPPAAAAVSLKLNSVQELYRLNYTHFGLLDNNSVSLILQYLPFNEICKIKSTNKLIYSVSNSSILSNQLIINYNPIDDKPHINISTINTNLVSHLKFNLTLDNQSNINKLSKLNQLKSIELYMWNQNRKNNKLELNFLNELLLLQHISIDLNSINKLDSVSFNDIAFLLSNININRNNINNQLLSIELICYEYQSDTTSSPLADIGLIFICNNCPQLKCLKICNTIITDSGLSYLKQLNLLERLAITSSDSISDNGLLVLLELGNSITELDLSCNPKLTNSYLSIISQLLLLKLFKFTLKGYEESKFSKELSPAEGLKLLSKSKSIETLIINCSNWHNCDLGSNLIELSTLRNLSISAIELSITDNGIESLSKLIQLTGLELNIISKAESDYKLLNKLSSLTNLKSLVLDINYFSPNLENEFKLNPELYSMIQLIHSIPSLTYFSLPNRYLYNYTIAREYNRKWSKLLFKQRPRLYYDSNYYYNELLQKPSKWFNSVL